MLFPSVLRESHHWLDSRYWQCSDNIRIDAILTETLICSVSCSRQHCSTGDTGLQWGQAHVSSTCHNTRSSVPAWASWPQEPPGPTRVQFWPTIDQLEASTPEVWPHPVRGRGWPHRSGLWPRHTLSGRCLEMRALGGWGSWSREWSREAWLCLCHFDHSKYGKIELDEQ